MDQIGIIVQSPAAENSTTTKGHLMVLSADGDSDSNTNDGQDNEE